jgi:benzoylformate decarboxylase
MHVSDSVGADVVTAAEAAVDVLAQNGVTVLFSNPGTTELPFLKQLTGAGSRVRYVPTVHETAAVGAALGYALASASPGVALVHALPGLGNALGMYFNAFRSGIPLVLFAGQQDRRHQYREPLLQAEMTDVGRAVSKHVWEVRTAAELPDVVERALLTATTPPTGPVLLSVPMDVWDEPVSVQGRRPVDRRASVSAAPDADIDALAEAIVDAEAPVFVAGDLVGLRRASAALRELADASGATVFWAPGAALANFPTTSPYYGGQIFHNSASFTRAFGDADLAVLFGTDLQSPLLFSGTDVIPRGCRVMSLTETPADGTGVVPVELDVHGDIATSLRVLADAVARRGCEQRARLDERRAAVQEQRIAAQGRLRDRALGGAAETPMTGAAAVLTILDAAPADAVVVDESVSNSWISLLGRFDDELGYVSPGGGGALGYGIGASAGVKVALPDRPVLAIVGDGATLYGLHGLWTLAHERLPVVICVVNNSGYTILKNFLRDRFNADDADIAESIRSLSIAEPPVDVVGLAAAYGLDATRAADADECRAAVVEAFASGRPWVIDVTVA